MGVIWAKRSGTESLVTKDYRVENWFSIFAAADCFRCTLFIHVVRKQPSERGRYSGRCSWCHERNQTNYSAAADDGVSLAFLHFEDRVIVPPLPNLLAAGRIMFLTCPPVCVCVHACGHVG